MTDTSVETEAEITRLFFVEHWKIGTITAQLGVHVDVVRRILGLGDKRAGTTPRSHLVDPYRAFIHDTLESYPRLRSTRLYDMLRDRGFTGAPRTLRAYVARVRPRPRREVFLRTEPMIAEQAQVDWAYVGKIPVPGGERALWLFVIVLSYSRAIWGEFVLDLSVHSLCRSLVRAATAFSGLPRQFLFDNPKIVVLERRGDAVRFHPVLLELCAQLRVQPRLCAVARPQHKGRVERAIRYLRDRFLAGRTINSVGEGNALLQRFLLDIAHARPHPVHSQQNVGDVFTDEQPRLLSLPNPLPPTELVLPATVDRQAFVRFDTNRYSVPPTYAERTLSLVADDVVVRLLDGDTLVATHDRCFGKRQINEDHVHREILVAQRRAAADSKGRDRLRATAPDFSVLLERWVNAGPALASLVSRATKLLDLYGSDIFAAAVTELVTRGLHDVGALTIACDRLRRDRQRPVPIDMHLPPHLDDHDVIPHNLENYDAQR
jgi:transposase